MNLPTKQQIGEAWPFTGGEYDSAKLGPLVLDSDDRAGKRTTTPTFDIGQRVLCNGTLGAIDAAYRAGGIGTVDHVIDYAAPITKAPQVLVYVILDDAIDQRPQPYHPHELKAAPVL